MSTHRFTAMALAAGLVLVAAIPVAAKPTAKPKVKPATARATTVKPTTAHGPKTAPTVKTHGASATAHGSKAQAKAVKPTQATAAKGQTKKTNGSAAKATTMTAETKQGSGKKVRDTRPASTDVDANPTTNTANLSKAQQLLMKNENLRLKMLDRLPPDTKVIPAAAGFKNLGQFVAAVNVSHNQGIDFFALKALMVGPESMSLGQAIQQLKGTDPTTSRRIADNAAATAQVDLDGSADTTTTTTKTKTKGRN